MSTRPTDKELKAISNLVTHPDFQIFMGYVEACLETETNTCIYSDSPDARGRAQILKELKATIDEARDNAQSRVAKRAVRMGGGNAF